MIAIDSTMLTALRHRRSAGESVKALAAEIGMTWQKLDKAIRHGLPGRRAENRMPYWLQRQRAKERVSLKRELARLGVTFDSGETSIEVLQKLLAHTTTPKTISAGGQAHEAVTALLSQANGHGPLTEKYRPKTLAAMFGQERIVKVLRKFAANPYPTAFIFEGETGTGKTSAALAMAEALGCDMANKEFGGIYVVASGEQSADAVREITRQMWNTPFHGSGWKVVIVNEADRMHPAAEAIWLDRLEALPQRTVIVFTTNYPDRLSQRFRDRCTRLGFESDAQHLEQALRELLSAMWMAETSDRASPANLIDRIVSQSVENGKVSFRRAVQLMAPAVMSAKDGAA